MDHNLSHQDSSTEEYRYDRLDPAKREIRVLKLEKQYDSSSINEALRFTVNTIRLREPGRSFNSVRRLGQRYYAISYAWGSKIRPCCIVLNGKEASVPDSAEEALRGVLGAMHKAGLSCSAYIWIDAICIDQGNTKEKSSQVNMMGDIYSMAEGTLVWWGHDYDGDAWTGFKDFKVFAKEIRRTKGLPVPIRERFDSSRHLLKLLDCRWFSRLWVVQEVVLAKAVYCFQGVEYLPWTTFSAVTDGVPTDRFTPQSLVNTRVMCDLVAAPKRSVTELLGLNSHVDASNAHDRVYAILGMASCGRDAMDIDYDRPLWEVYARGARTAIHTDQSLNILWQPAFKAKTDDDSFSDWQSWVPRFHALSFPQKKVICYLLGAPTFDASKGVSCSTAHVSGTSKSLNVRGVAVGKITGRNWYGGTSFPRPGYESYSRFVSLFTQEALARLGMEKSKKSYEAILGALASNDNDTNHPFLKSGSEIAQLILQIHEHKNWHELLSFPEADSRSRPARLLADIAPYERPYWGHYDMIRLSGGVVGMSTTDVDIGDIVCVLFGSNAPLVLRPLRLGEWQLRGIANIPGIMQGQYIQRLKDSGRLEEETRTFTLL